MSVCVNISRPRHTRLVIACTRLCTCLKHQRRAKKSLPCLIQKASRCVADRTSNISVFYLSLSIKHKDLTRKSCLFIFYLIGSEVKVVCFYWTDVSKVLQDRCCWKLDQHQQGPIGSVLLVIIGWLLGWLVMQFSQKRL